MGRTIEFIKKNSTVSLCITVFIILLLVMTIFWISKKGTFSIDEKNSVVIECPSVFERGKTIECDVSLVMVDSTKVYSINANYDFDDEITYESFGVDNTECTGEGCLEALEITENGFAVINVDGFTGSISFGKLKVKMPDEATPDTQYKIGLKNIELSFDENGEVSDEMLELDDSFASSRTGNNVATLSTLSLGDIVLNEEFDSNVFKYSASVNKDINNATINYTLTDENAIVSDNSSLGNVNLHYGTNVFNIVVTSEDGSTTNTYEISIYRNYEFSTSVYMYDKDNNYIYTRTDSGDEIISNLEQLSDNLHYELKDNNSKLSIIYGEEEELLTINIINFSLEYEIVNNSIYISNNLTYGELIDKINGESITIKLVDKDNVEITNEDTVIENNYKLNIYYNSKLLDSLKFIKEYLKIDDSLIVDNQNMMIKRLKLGTTYGEFKNNFDTSGTITFISWNGKNITDSDVLKTKDIVRIKLGDNTIEYTLSVLGDISGSGIVDINDVGMLYRYFRKKIELSDAAINAGFIWNNGTININDVGTLYRYYRGKITLPEVNK